MAVQRQAMCTGQARRAGAHHRHLFARDCRAAEERRARIGKKRIGGHTLQRTDLHRLVFIRVAHTGLFTQHLGGAHPRAHAAQRVGLQDGLGGTPGVALRDAGDEAGDVDAGGAGGDARGVETVVAPLGFDQRLGGGERWVRVSEVARVVGQVQPAGM
jgi:hypothetical protein